MIHKVKPLSIALVCLVVAGMMSAASAVGSELHIYNTTNTTGQQTTSNAFTTDMGISQCAQAGFEGTLIESGEMNELTLTGTYTGCQAFGQAATVDMNGCKYTVTGAGQPGQTAIVDITGCTSGKGIEITVPICRITVPEQHSVGHVVFQNVASPGHVNGQATIQGIAYESHGGLCPNMGGKSTIPTSNGQYTGQVTIKAFEDFGSEQATHNNHQYDKLKCGDQIGLLST